MRVVFECDKHSEAAGMIAFFCEECPPEDTVQPLEDISGTMCEVCGNLIGPPSSFVEKESLHDRIQ